jgi:hypothetical protein
MGYLTTLTIYNDGAHLIKPNAQEFADGVYEAMVTTSVRGPMDLPVAHFVNCVRVQRSRHADDHTVYVHKGNCLTEMNAYSEDTRELLKRNPQFFEKLLDEMKWQVRELGKLLKEHRAKGTAE